METHFEGSRGSEQTSEAHQRQYDEQNRDTINHVDSDDDNQVKTVVNTDFEHSSDTESLTNDEDAGTDPNQVDDKPSFRNDND